MAGVRADDEPGKPPTASREEVAAAYEKQVKPMLAQYCYECHGDQKQKGDLNLASFQTLDHVMKSADEWRDVRTRLREMEMPPKKKEQPADAQRDLVIAWITKAVGDDEVDCGNIATDRNTRFYSGHVMGRRLNRLEYQNTLRDLLGVDVPVADLLPEDGAGGEGFDTDGDALFISAISIEKYLQAANRVLGAVFVTSPDDQSAATEAARKRLFVTRPESGKPPRVAAQIDLKGFADRAFRRPVTDAELENHLKFFDSAQKRGDSFEASLQLAFKSVLISPNFLFLTEPWDQDGDVLPLDDYRLASRLSYFLWSSMPDDELFSLAASKQLHEDSVLKQQVRRMLKHPRSLALAQSFTTQWLGIVPLGGSTRPDPKRFPDFNDELAADEKQEAVLLLDSILRDDRGLLDLINANYTFLNRRLATLYGIPGVDGDQLRKVQLSADNNRGGILGLAAVLTTTSYPLRTSPVLRGKWVLEQVLGEKMRPPPPTAGQLPQDDHQADGLTFRQRLEQHRTRAECASCHQRMDPLGFGLENFDAIGRWRTTEAGGPIDASGKLTTGEAFSGPVELRKVLLKRKDQFLTNLTRKMMGYALGRGLGRFDDCVVKDTVKALAGNDNRSSVLIEQIVLSKPFRYRFVKK